MFEGTVGKSLRLGEVSKIHENVVIGYLCVEEAWECFLRKYKLWFGRNDF